MRDGPRPVVGGPPVAGPPVDEPEPELKPSAIIQPVRRPILKPRVDDDEEDESGEAVLRPTTRRVLQPTPAKATLTPKRVLEPVEEEGTDEDSD